MNGSLEGAGAFGALIDPSDTSTANPINNDLFMLDKFCAVNVVTSNEAEKCLKRSLMHLQFRTPY